MGAIGEPKREIHIPVTRPGAPEPRRAPEPVPESPQPSVPDPSGPGRELPVPAGT
jgi:hypothetical protein